MKRLFAVGRVERHHCPECRRITEHVVSTDGKWELRECSGCKLVSQWRVGEAVK